MQKLRAFVQRNALTLSRLPFLSLMAVIVLLPGATPYFHSNDFALITALQRHDDAPFYGHVVWRTRPLATFIFKSIFTLFGADAAAFHLSSSLAHLAASCALFLFLRDIFKAPRAPAFVASLAGALVFLTYPRHDEAIFWASSIAYPFAGLLGIVGLLLAERCLSGTSVSTL